VSSGFRGDSREFRLAGGSGKQGHDSPTNG
jgi:hypothetical protein